MTSFVAISTGPETHLDHLAPLCVLMQMPLIVTDEDQLLLCRTFYPDVEVRQVALAEMTLDFLIQFEAIFHCGKFWALELKPLMHLLFGKQPRFVHCPHGNSDKEAALSPKAPQDISLIYGEQMRAHTAGTLIETGNLRLSYYLERRSHFDRLAQEKVFSRFDVRKKTLLYAPTWTTQASPTSFFDSAEQLIEELSDEYNLLIKLHPLLPETHPAHYWRIIGHHENRASICFLTQFPAIYPLLEKSDAYIGDYSSIGYDFLLYDRPLYFLKAGPSTALQRCGQIVNPSEIKNFLKKEGKEFSEMKRRAYAHAFRANLHPAQIAQDIKKALTLEKIGQVIS